jgi:hypothetical protein
LVSKSLEIGFRNSNIRNDSVLPEIKIGNSQSKQFSRATKIVHSELVIKFDSFLDDFEEI